MIAAVVLDMDGLMVDTEAIVKPCFLRAAADLRCDVEEDFYTALIGRGTRDADAAMLARFGPAFPLDDFKQRVLAAVRAHMTSVGVPVKPGLRELLDLVEAHRLPIAVATSTEREDAEFTLVRAGVRGRVPVLVTGDEVVRGKPEPDIYLRAAERLGVDPRSCVALEDSGPGVLAASRAGMRALLVPDAAHTPSEAARAVAFCVLPSLHEAAALLRAWLTAPDAGLCACCTHAQTITSSRGATFLRCNLSFSNPAFPRYPSLPVLRCVGHRPRLGASPLEP